MTALHEILSLAPVMEVVDVGANPIDGDPPYKPLLQRGLCRVTGFEPQPAALAQLLAAKGVMETYLPYALGGGGEVDLNICVASGMTSVMAPDRNTLELFSRLDELAQVKEVASISTRRLDDVEEVKSIDFLKIDVQGFELEIMRNGMRKLAEAALIQIEVSFTPLYEGQPVFGEIDLFLRGMGFVPHCFAALKQWPIAPCVINGNVSAPLNHLLEADVVYVRDFTRRTTATDRQLKAMALAAHHCYGSIDLTMRCIQLLQERGSTPPDALQVYIASLQR